MNISKSIKKNKYIFYNGLVVVFLVMLIFFFFYSGEAGVSKDSPSVQALVFFLVNGVIVFFGLRHFMKVKSNYSLEGFKVGLIWFLLFLLADRLVTIFFIGQGFFYYLIPRSLVYLVFFINFLGLGYLLGIKLDKK